MRFTTIEEVRAMNAPDDNPPLYDVMWFTPDGCLVGVETFRALEGAKAWVGEADLADMGGFKEGALVFVLNAPHLKYFADGNGGCRVEVATLPANAHPEAGELERLREENALLRARLHEAAEVKARLQRLQTDVLTLLNKVQEG
jgi:hypothetical protein